MELYHHGILGQKWGVRRFQNEDGSYTQAGLNRYREAKNLSKIALDAYNSGKISKKDLRHVEKNEIRAYRHLKKDVRADKGKMLKAKGKNIADNRYKSRQLAKTSFYAGSNPMMVYTGMQAPILGYRLTRNMIRRFENINMRAYKNYNGRSIEIGNQKTKEFLESKLADKPVKEIIID